MKLFPTKELVSYKVFIFQSIKSCKPLLLNFVVPLIQNELTDVVIRFDAPGNFVNIILHLSFITVFFILLHFHKVHGSFLI